MWKLISRSEANTTIVYKYNSEEQLVKIINEYDQSYRFELDAEGNIIEEIGFDDITCRYERNQVGWINQILRPAEKFIKYNYDPCGRITEILYSDEKKESYTYRPDGELLEAVNEYAIVQFERNAMGDILKETVNNDWVAFENDVFGNRTKINSCLGANILQQYSKMREVLQMSANGWFAKFEYDNLNYETLRLLPGNISNNWQRDGIGRPIAQIIGHISGNHFDLQKKKQYRWDVNKILKQIKDEKGVINFEYDNRSYLIRTIYPNQKEQIRNPDPVGNLFETIDHADRVYAKGGQLRKKDGWKYNYDAEGNLIEKSGIDGNRWFYFWNDAGMLIKVIRPDKVEVKFTYDAFGRRLSKHYKNTVTKFIWQGNRPLHEWKEHAITKEKLSDINVESDGIITWIFDPGSFVPAGKIKDCKKYSIITDHIGTPNQMYKEDGKLFWECDLDSYGQVRMEKGEIGSCPFRYQGQYEDIETGLYYNRFRYYSATDGMYISQDPIKTDGGIKLYSYAKDPNIWLDIFGLYHANDSRSPRAQHGYEIRDRHGRVVKTGVSSGRIRQDGRSSRAERQVRAANARTDLTDGPYTSHIVTQIPSQPNARGQIYDWERNNANANRATLDDRLHQMP